MKNYEINEKTMAIIPISYFKTKIIEEEEEFIVEENASTILKNSCEFYGSSYEGRVKASKKMIKGSYKLPILVEESEYIIFFPTRSSEEEGCSWLNYNYIKDFTNDNGNTKIIFKNNKTETLDISKLSLNNQILRSSMLESVIRKRKKSVTKNSLK